MSSTGRPALKKGELRTQFSYITDIAPTVLEAANLPFPTSVNGTVTETLDGESLVYTFDNPKAPEKHTTQYFEMFGNRGIYHDGWVAAARHSIPWLIVQNPPLSQDVWELYHVADDFSEGHDLAGKDPAKLKELQNLFMKEAEKNHVLPIDDRRSERFNAAIAGRPDLWAAPALLWPDAPIEEHRKELIRTLRTGMYGILPMAIFVSQAEDETLTGFIEVGLRSHADGCDTTRPVGFIEGWFVMKPSGQGIGAALLRSAEDWVANSGASRLPPTPGSTTKYPSSPIRPSATKSSTAASTSASRYKQFLPHG